MAITTNNSIRVKPRADQRTPRIWLRQAAGVAPGAAQRPLRSRGGSGAAAPGVGLLPGADVGIVAFAAGLPVGAEAEDVDLALHARVDVLVRPAPRVVRQLGLVGPPVGRDRAGGRLDGQRGQALLGGRVALVVEPVALQGLHQGVHVGARGGAAGIVDAGEQVGHDQGPEHADDDEHDQQFDQGEAAGSLTGAAAWQGSHRGARHGRGNRVVQ
jgi:hypothetical protein